MNERSTTDMEDIISIVRTLLDNRVTVIRDDSFPTCAWEYKSRTMVLSRQIIPQVLWDTPMEGHLLTGGSIHECGHPLFDEATLALREQKCMSVKNPKLMKDAMNLIQDAGVNFRMENEWSHIGFASSLRTLMVVIGKGLIADNLAAIKKHQPPDPIQIMLSMGNFYAKLSEVKSILKSFTPTQVRLIREGIACTIMARTAFSWETKSGLFDEMYRIMTKLLSSQNKGGSGGCGDSMPTQMGGSYVVQGDEATKKAAQKALADAQGEAEGKGEGDGESEGDGDSEGDGSKSDKASKDGGGDKKSKSVGYDPLGLAPTPHPDPINFANVVGNVQQEVKEILDRLKEQVFPKIVLDRYLPRGRIMPHLLARASIQTVPPRDIYTRMRNEPDEEPTRWVIVVDLSGSMNVTEAIKALTVFSEVASQYLRDDEFAIYAFGSGWVKVKSFYEQYENVKARIGGLTGMGGTALHPVLEAVETELWSLTNHHKNRVIIVSDFEMYHEDESKSMTICKTLVKEFAHGKVIGLDFGDGTEKVSRYLKAERIRSIAELPDKFIDAYLKDVTPDE